MTKHRLTREDLKSLPDHIRRQLEAKLSGNDAGRRIGNQAGRTKPTDRRKSESPPHDILWAELADIEGIVREYQGAVPGRRFRLDIALPDIKLAVEVDGWQYHGKFKDAHAKDRERQNLLVLEGWQVLRFSAGQIYSETDKCVKTILKKIVDLQHKQLENERTT